jgi:O-antigen/teichoic acid export membrane protein
MSEPATTSNARALGGVAAHGSLLAMAQVVLSKVASLAGMLVLAWLLTPEEFGPVAKAFAVASYVTFIQAVAVGDVVIRHNDQFDRYATPAFWLSLWLSLALMAVCVVSAPIAERVLDTPTLGWLLILIGLRNVGQALASVPLARLRLDFRFRFITTVNVASVVGMTAMSIAMAWLGYGATSILLPPAVFAFIQCAVFWKASGFRLGAASPDLQRSMLRDTLWVSLGLFLTNVVSGSDYLALGIFQSDDMVGLYYFAFNLSTQVNVLVAVQISSTLQPIFAHLGADPARQASAFMRSVRAVAAIAIPLCLLQAACAGTAVHAFFDAKWIPAIPMLAVLSVAQAFAVVTSPCSAMYRARGRFGLLFWVLAAQALLFLALVFPAARFGGGLLVACAILVQTAVSAIPWIALAIPKEHRSHREILGTVAVPLACALPVALPAWWLLSAVPRDRVASMVALAVATLFVVGGTAAVMALAAPRTTSDLMSILSRFLPRLPALDPARRPRLALAALVAFAFASAPFAAAWVWAQSRIPPRSDWREIAPGIAWRSDEADGTERASGRMTVVRIDASNPGVELFVTPPVNPEPMLPFVTRHLHEQMRSEDLVAAMNGTFYAAPGAEILPIPMLPVRALETIVSALGTSHVDPHSYLVWQGRDGALQVELAKPPPDAALAEAIWGVGIQSVPLRGGAIEPYFLAASPEREKWSFLGIGGAGRTLYLGQFEDAERNYALEHMASLGCEFGGFVDSGSSSGLAIDDPEKGLLLMHGVKPVPVVIGARAKR